MSMFGGWACECQLNNLCGEFPCRTWAARQQGNEGVVVEITELNEDGTFVGSVQGNALYLTPLGTYRLTRIEGEE